MMTWRIVVAVVVVFGVMVQHDDVLLVKRRWCCLVGGRWIIGLYGISSFGFGLVVT